MDGEGAFVRIDAMKPGDPEAYYRKMSALVGEMPFLRAVDERGQSIPEVQKWIDRLFALVEETRDIIDLSQLKMHSSRLSDARFSHSAVSEITAVLYRALGRAEAVAPATSR